MVWVLEVNNFYLGNFIWEIFSLNIMPYWFAICCVVGKRRKDIANFEIILYQQCGLAQHTELLRTVHALLLYLVKKKKVTFHQIQTVFFCLQCTTVYAIAHGNANYPKWQSVQLWTPHEDTSTCAEEGNKAAKGLQGMSGTERLMPPYLLTLEKRRPR